MANRVIIVALAELAGERDAGKILEPGPVDGVDVEPDDEWGEKPHVHEQWQHDEDALAVLVEGAKGDVGQEGERQQQATKETKDVSDVVYPRQQTTEEEEENKAEQLEEGVPWLLQHLPALKELYEKAR